MAPSKVSSVSEIQAFPGTATGAEDSTPVAGTPPPERLLATSVAASSTWSSGLAIGKRRGGQREDGVHWAEDACDRAGNRTDDRCDDRRRDFSNRLNGRHSHFSHRIDDRRGQLVDRINNRRGVLRITDTGHPRSPPGNRSIRGHSAVSSRLTICRYVVNMGTITPK